MEKMFSILRRNGLFYSITFVLICAISCFLSFFSRGKGFMLLTGFRTTFLTVFFEVATFFGDGLCIILLALIIFIFFKKHRKLAFLLIFSYLFSGLLAQVLKSMVSAPRPAEYFKMQHYKYYIDAFAHCRVGFRSFPSGHTASAFAATTVVSLYAKRKHFCIPLLVFSGLIGFSRVYLAHHFPADVFGGLLIGMVCGTLSVYWFMAFDFSRIFKKKRKVKEAPESVLT